MYDRDLYRKILNQADKKRLLPTSLSQAIIGQNSRMNSRMIGKPMAVFDAETDQIWAYDARKTKAPHSYFDYYFTGQDVKIYIDGTDESSLDSSLPIMQFAWKVTQQKSPLFGYASYTYDAMMRGTRIVNGVFRIATTSTNYLTDLIAEATESRVNQENLLAPIRGLDEDEQNIDRYWTKTIDTSKIATKNLWSSHPPFNFVVVYGVQSTSLYENLGAHKKEILKTYTDGDNPMFVDTNERLTEADPGGNSMRRIIENVELMDMQVEYGPEGQICSEVYSFAARDVYYPMPSKQIGAGVVPQRNNTQQSRDEFFVSGVNPFA